MDLAPNQVIRIAQLGQIEKVMRTEAIWLCVSCQTCSARCPKEVDCAGFMDGMRQMAAEQAATSPAQVRTVLFQKAFLRNIRRNGRLNELELVGVFKTSAFFADLQVPLLFKDVMLAPRLGALQKLHLQGEKVRDRDVVGRIFDRCLREA
jgi:heterodisulfide reductase subunit C2